MSNKSKKTSIGGQALIEGIMMKGPEKTAMAVRNASGQIVLEKWENTNKTPVIAKIPVLRGVYGMISSLSTGYKCLMRSADIAMEDILNEEENKIEKVEVNELSEKVEAVENAQILENADKYLALSKSADKLKEFAELINMCKCGINELISIQKEALKEAACVIGENKNEETCDCN